MTRLSLLVAALCGAALAIGTTGGGAGTATVTCIEAFSGTAYDVVVPDDNFCDLTGATIAHDVIIGADAGAGSDNGLSVGHDVTLQHDAEVDFGGAVIGHDLVATTNGSLHLERTTIRGDLIAFQPATVQTGQLGPDTPGGPVHVEHDLMIQGTPPDNDFVFDGLFRLSVDRDLQVSGRSVPLGFTVGGDTIGRDLVITNDAALSGFFGPSSLNIVGNTVGRDLIFTGNTAAAGGSLVVSHNVVGRDAICAADNPTPTDGNTVTRANTCG
jgi:hypothetical protein